MLYIIYQQKSSPFFRLAGGACTDERQAGRDPEGPRHIPGDQEADLPKILLSVQWWFGGDPRAAKEPRSHAAPPEEVFRQHQEPAHWGGRESQAYIHSVASGYTITVKKRYVSLFSHD